MRTAQIGPDLRLHRERLRTPYVQPRPSSTMAFFKASALAFLYLKDSNHNNGGGRAKDVNVIIPLNRCSFFEELEDKMLVSMQLQFNIELNNDDELIHKAAAAAGRVIVNRFLLWVPKLTPKGSM